jgi:hypothetical protein
MLYVSSAAQAALCAPGSQALQYEAAPQLLGASVFSYADVFARLRRFVAQWRAAGSPRLYVASLDVARAFDSIPITPLWQVGGGALQRVCVCVCVCVCVSK